MEFEEWLNKAGEDIDKRFKKDAKKYKGLVANDYFQRLNELYIGYNTSETNRKLVWATWTLAVGTLILLGLTLYFQYLAK